MKQLVTKLKVLSESKLWNSVNIMPAQDVTAHQVLEKLVSRRWTHRFLPYELFRVYILEVFCFLFFFFLKYFPNLKSRGLWIRTKWITSITSALADYILRSLTFLYSCWGTHQYHSWRYLWSWSEQQILAVYPGILLNSFFVTHFWQISIFILSYISTHFWEISMSQVWQYELWCLLDWTCS